MYCQSCGGQNPDDARFCNMCGSRIAGPGAPGGPLADGTVQGVGDAAGQPAPPPAAAASVPAQPQEPAHPQPAQPQQPVSQMPANVPQGGPPQQQNIWAQHEGAATQSGSLPHPMGYAPQGGGPAMSSVSLHAIGVQSSRKTWAVLIGTAVMLVALGAVGAFLAMGGSSDGDDAVAAGGSAGDMEIGTPLPEGMEAPEVDFVSGGVRVAEGEGGSGSSAGAGGGGGGSTGGGGGSGGGSGGGGSAGGGGGGGSAGGGGSGGGGGGSASAGGGGGSAGGGGGSSGGGGSAGGGGSGGGGGSAGGGGGSGGGSGSTGGGGSGDTAGDGSSGGGGGGSGGGTDTVPEGELPEERDIALEMYASRVRFVIRRYYAARAQTCFDRATRNNPGLRGTVVVRFTIGADGNVTDSSAIRNTTGEENLGTCLANQVGSWRLPAPEGGPLTLEMPFSN